MPETGRPSATAARDQPVSGVGHERRAGVRHERNAGAGAGALEQAGDAGLLVVFVQRRRRDGDAVMREQAGRGPRVLAQDQLGAAQGGQRAGRDVAEVARVWRPGRGRMV